MRTRPRCSRASSGRRVHPVHLVGDAHDLRRSRVTVFFRILLALPHIVWLALWSIAAFVVAILNWFATLFTGTPPRAFHQFLSRYIRYALHVAAFIYLVANPFPGFTGKSGTYPLDLVLPERRGRTDGRPVSGSSSSSRPSS